MVLLTKLNGQPFILNSDLIETITQNPDTTIMLTNGKLYIAAEPMDDIVEKITHFRHICAKGYSTEQQ